MSQQCKIELEGEDVSGFLFTVGNRISVQRVQVAHLNEEPWAGKFEVSSRIALQTLQPVGYALSLRRRQERSGVTSTQKAVIVGGGPSGLYSALQLFLSGFAVTLVNDRAQYIRNQYTKWNSNWMIQL
uniref:FAD/NAD(P)-binding domain-containing protein n=1 Tax=Ditylenchus dipsaci TaxID=166011 RepID=A0A915EQF1_9BILA